MSKSKQPLPYAELRDELDGLLLELQDSSLDIDEAIKKHDRAMQIIDQLEAHLKTAENTIKRSQKKADTKQEPPQ